MTGGVNLGTVDTAEALFVLDACKRAPAAPAFASVVAHLELMVALADRRAAAAEPEFDAAPV